VCDATRAGGVGLVTDDVLLDLFAKDLVLGLYVAAQVGVVLKAPVTDGTFHGCLGGAAC